MSKQSLSQELLDLSEKLIVKARDNKSSSGLIRDRLLGPWPQDEKKGEELESAGVLHVLRVRMKAAIGLMMDTRGNLGVVLENIDPQDLNTGAVE